MEQKTDNRQTTENNGNNRKNGKILNFDDFCQKILQNYVLWPKFEVIDECVQELQQFLFL